MSNIDIKNLRDYIELREEYWEYDFSTNCYAFALGLDIPENKIIRNAYQPGVIGVTINNIPIAELKKMTFEQRLLFDLKSLKIKYKEISCSEQSGYEFIYKKNKLKYIDNYWIISLFLSRDTFHFMRKSYNGTWWQKNGYLAQPNNWDLDGKIITNPEICNMGEYKYVKSYKLQCTEIV